MVVVPIATPLTIPVVEPISAIDELAVDQVPPAVVLDSVIVAPVQTTDTPVMAAGEVVTVTLLVDEQPASIYEMLVTPANIPVTMPVVAPIVALDVKLLDHVPPVELVVSVIVLPVHTLDNPLIDAGEGFIVTVL